MTRSALPTGPCGSSTPSLHDAINVAALVIEIARSHIEDALGVLVTSEDIRPGLAACITDSIGIHWRGWTWGGILWKPHALPNPPNGGLTIYVVAEFGPGVPVGTVREDLSVILAKGATPGGNTKHQLPIAWKSNAPAAAPVAKLATATHMRRNRDLMASPAATGTPRIISAISIII